MYRTYSSIAKPRCVGNRFKTTISADKTNQPFEKRGDWAPASLASCAALRFGPRAAERAASVRRRSVWTACTPPTASRPWPRFRARGSCRLVDRGPPRSGCLERAACLSPAQIGRRAIWPSKWKWRRRHRLPASKHRQRSSRPPTCSIMPAAARSTLRLRALSTRKATQQREAHEEVAARQARGVGRPHIARGRAASAAARARRACTRRASTHVARWAAGSRATATAHHRRRGGRAQ